MINSELNYDPKLREKFRSGFLPKEWRRKYNGIFDNDDLRLALSQPNYHFSKWFVAVHFANQGYKVLVEQYIYKTHPLKLKILSNHLTPNQIALLHNREVQPPDLFVYRNKEFFFAEVKRDKDLLSEKQRTFFENISGALRCSFYLVSLRHQI